MTKYKVEVVTSKVEPLHYAHAAIEFDSAGEAHEYALNLFMRWTAVVYWRVVEKGTTVALFTNEPDKVT